MDFYPSVNNGGFYSIFFSGANTLELIEELGLESKLKPIKYGHPATVNRMVYVNGKLHKLPSSFKSIFTHQPPFSKPLFWAGIKEFFTPQKRTQDESIFDFVSRRFGADVAQYAIGNVDFLSI